MGFSEESNYFCLGTELFVLEYRAAVLCVNSLAYSYHDKIGDKDRKTQN